MTNQPWRIWAKLTQTNRRKHWAIAWFVFTVVASALSLLAWLSKWINAEQMLGLNLFISVLTMAIDAYNGIRIERD